MAASLATAELLTENMAESESNRHLAQILRKQHQKGGFGLFEWQYRISSALTPLLVHFAQWLELRAPACLHRVVHVVPSGCVVMRKRVTSSILSAM